MAPRQFQKDPVGKSLTFQVSDSKCFLQALTQHIFKWVKKKKKRKPFSSSLEQSPVCPSPEGKKGKRREVCVE